jgi:hypothetical protein
VSAHVAPKHDLNRRAVWCHGSSARARIVTTGHAVVLGVVAAHGRCCEVSECDLNGEMRKCHSCGGSGSHFRKTGDRDMMTWNFYMYSK